MAKKVTKKTAKRTSTKVARSPRPKAESRDGRHRYPEETPSERTIPYHHGLHVYRGSSDYRRAFPGPS